MLRNDLYIQMYYEALNIQVQIEGFKAGLGSELDHKHLIQLACMKLYKTVEAIKDGE